MSVVLLVRHAQASFGARTYDELSPQGLAQARRLAEVLQERGTPVQRIVSGDLARQRGTAAAIREMFPTTPLVIDPRWNEYDALPLIARARPRYRRRWVLLADLARQRERGRRLAELIDEALHAWVADGSSAESDDSPGAFETFPAFSSRVRDGLVDVAQEPGVSVVVSSAGAIAAAVAPLLGEAANDWLGLQRVMVNASLTKVVRGSRGITLVSFNEHGHLEGASGVRVTYR